MSNIPPGTPVRLRASGLSGIVRETVKGGYRVEIPSAAPLPGGLPHTAIVAADELEAQPTASEAHRIASARLGPALHHVTRGGPAADEWLVQAVPPTGPLLSARAAGLEEAIGEAEAQLRAAGWVPTHPRLVWRRNQIVMMFGALAFPVVTVVTTGEEVAVLIHPSVTAWMYFPDMSAAYARISEWCAANLPSLHLPPFPETPDAY